MSHRDDRSSDARRHRFRPDREPSPKRYRRDDHKQERDRPPAETKSDKAHDSDKKHHRGPRDPLHLVDTKVETRTMSKDTDSRTNGGREGTKKSSDPAKVPQSRTYSQHDNRASVGQTGRSTGRRADEEHGWRNFKDHSNDRKRPAFREHKAGTDPGKSDKVVTDSAVGNGRRDRFDSDRSERNGGSSVTEAWGRRDRYGDGGIGVRNRERERLNSGARWGPYQRPGGARVEKWKHDLYDEANKSPNPKNEEDRISKIEALLAS